MSDFNSATIARHLAGRTVLTISATPGSFYHPSIDTLDLIVFLYQHRALLVDIRRYLTSLVLSTSFHASAANTFTTEYHRLGTLQAYPLSYRGIPPTAVNEYRPP